MRSKDHLQFRESEQPKKGRRNWKSEEIRAALIEECRAFAEENGRFPSRMVPEGTRELHLAQSVANGLKRGLFTERERAALQGMGRSAGSHRNWKSEEDRAALVEECRAFAEENGRFPCLKAPKGTRELHLAQSVSNGLKKGLFTEREKAFLEKMGRGKHKPSSGLAINVTRDEAVKINALAAERGISVHELLHEIVLQHIELIRKKEQELQ